jgi:hypothetical protein
MVCDSSEVSWLADTVDEGSVVDVARCGAEDAGSAAEDAASSGGGRSAFSRTRELREVSPRLKEFIPLGCVCDNMGEIAGSPLLDPPAPFVPRPLKTRFNEARNSGAMAFANTSRGEK